MGREPRKHDVRVNLLFAFSEMFSALLVHPVLVFQQIVVNE